MGRFLLIGLGGVIGAILRYVIGTQTQAWFRSEAFPYGILLVNLTGCFAIGLAFFWLAARGEPGNAGLFLITGILGAYTTFSSFALDVFSMMQAGETAKALLYLALTNGLGLAAVWLGRLAALRLG
jgi:CrcB protein